MACDTKMLLYRAGDQSPKTGRVFKDDVLVDCGQCPPCKHRRVNDWVFRLEREEERSTSSHFITLTYDTDHVPITSNGFMTLHKRHFQLFMKRLRKNQQTKMKYYAVGEYGDQKYRPHYHAIIFNVEDINYFQKEWIYGTVHLGDAQKDSMAYTAKYIDKLKRIPIHGRDDRQKEFSLMSLGLGSNFMTENMINWYLEDYTRNYVINSTGHKQALPRYYRRKMFENNTKHLDKQLLHIQSVIKEKEELSIKEFEELYPNDQSITYEQWVESAKYGRYTKFYNTIKKRKQ